MSFTVLAACGSKGDKNPEATPDTTPEASAPVESEKPAFSADLSAFYAAIMEAAEEGPFMMDVAAEAEMLEMTYPGLANIETKQLVAFTPAMSAVAVEFAFAEVANAADVEAVKAIFQARIDSQVNGGAWYPETVESWKNNSEIVVIDNYVCLFVCAEKAGMIDALRNGTEVPAWAKAQTEGDMGDVEGGIMDMPVEDGPAAFDPEAEVSTAPEAPAASIELAAFYEKVYNTLYPLDADGFSTGPYATDLMDPEASGMPAEDVALMLEMYYPGLAAIETEQLHVYIPGMSFSAYEVVLAELTNAADMDAFKAILQGRIDMQAEGGAWYPEAVEGWKNNSTIVSNGNYVMMAVGSDSGIFVENFNNLF